MTPRPQGSMRLRGHWRRVPGIVAVCAVVATGLATVWAGMASANIDSIAGILGEAGPNTGSLGVLSLANGIDCKSGRINGDAAVVAGTFRNHAPCYISHMLLHSSSVTITGISKPGAIGGYPILNDNLTTHMKTDALNASTTFAKLTRTQAISGNAIRGNLTLRGKRGFNVVYVTDINLTGTLTLTGPRGTEWVINDSGNFDESSGGILLAGGVTTSDVVFNITSPTARVTTKAAAKGGNGILLAPHSSLSLSGSHWNGIVIGAGITLTSNIVITAKTPQIPSATVGISASPSDRVPLGTPVHVTAYPNAWSKPLGTVQFRYYFSRAQCRLATSAFNAGSRPSGGTYVSTGTVPASLIVPSRDVTFDRRGTVYWAAYYSGLISSNPAVAVNPAVSVCLPVHVS